MGSSNGKNATKNKTQTHQNKDKQQEENHRQNSEGNHGYEQQTQNTSNDEGTHHQMKSNPIAGNDNSSQYQGQIIPEHDTKYKALKDCIQGIDKSLISPEWIKNAETKLAELKKKIGNKDKIKENTSNGPDGEIQELKRQLLEVQEERGDLLTQISEVAGIRLKNNNPGIADLSDENRPAKIAEKFSELYDNEWTNVIECLKGIGVDDEEEMIEFLFDIVKNAYTWCRDKATKQVKELIDTLLFTKADDTGGNKDATYENVNYNVKPDTQKRCQEIIRRNSSNWIKGYEQECKTNILEEIFSKREKYKKIKSEQPFKEYVSECVYLSWYMSIQDPPVEMDLQEVNKLNTAQYRAYTKSGKFLDFVVWPALLLHSGGPILYKGVAQFCSKPKADYDMKFI